jgi:anaerobic ribonucleoside-triphosphate reductase
MLTNQNKNTPTEIKPKRTPCEVYSRVVGYLRPVSQWNKGKKEEKRERKNFNINDIEL